ncbi:MAG: 5-formyltetrahydrofolate cyclo-ligase [Lachnospiraceae bacterium]|nr:5-formyltetrahydrofolate cyclo-ligase [Lachnospiraceae bacterium]
MGEMLTKNEYRELVKNQRMMLGLENINQLSQVIIDEYCQLESYKNADVIMPYCSKDYEINTRSLIKRAIEDGKIVAVPKLIIDEFGEAYMVFVKINENTPFVKVKYNLEEPDSNDTYYPNKSQKIEYIMPGLAFDLNGGRIGYGGGYYDRYLSKYDMPNLHKVALALDFQIFDELPCNEYDRKYDTLISENRYFFRNY